MFLEYIVLQLFCRYIYETCIILLTIILLLIIVIIIISISIIIALTFTTGEIISNRSVAENPAQD